MEEQIYIFVGLAFLAFFKELLGKVFWSILLYWFRGEFNSDNNEATPDKFRLFNPNTGDFLNCYITRYSIFAVTWGFFNDGGYVIKKTSWLNWAGSSELRFPMPLEVKEEDLESIVKLVNIK